MLHTQKPELKNLGVFANRTYLPESLWLDIFKLHFVSIWFIFHNLMLKFFFCSNQNNYFPAFSNSILSMFYDFIEFRCTQI